MGGAVGRGRARRSSNNHLANLSASIHTRLIFTQHQRAKEKTDLMSASKWNGGVFFHIKQTGSLKVDMDRFQQN
jgi:hypothetical protein